ncbi:MAG: C25 family cysteine peptidase [Kiritimatiellia bacterium]
MPGSDPAIARPGEPELPVFVHAWADAAGAGWRIADIRMGDSTSRVVRVAPAPGDAVDPDPDLLPQGLPAGRREEAAIYRRNAFWPRDAVELVRAEGGDASLHRLLVHPVQYNPVTGELRQWKDLRVRLEPAGASASVAALAVAMTAAPTNAADFSETGMSPGSLFPSTHGTPDDFARRQPGADIGACVKIKVTARGMHKLTQAVLAAAGVPAAELVGSQVRMFHGDREIPVKVSTDGLFSASDSILFWGIPFESYHTAENCYWLGFAPGGLRMAAVSSPPVTGRPETTSYARQVTVDDRKQYFATLPSLYGVRCDDGIYDGWFYGTIKESGQPTLDLVFPGSSQAVAGSTVQWECLAWPSTEFAPNNGIRLLNGASAALATWVVPQNTRSLLTTTFPATNLSAGGSTTLKMQSVIQPGASLAFDRSALSYGKITFQRNLVADPAALTFGMDAGARNITVSGFSAGVTPRVYNITDPLAPYEVTGGVVAVAGAGVSVRYGSNFAALSGWHVTQDSGLVAVPQASVSFAAPKGLSDTLQQADFIVITPRSFATEAHRLLAHRDANGLRVAVATLEDIYDEFGYGIKDPHAIRQFLGYAYHHWKTPRPRYVVLAGDATFDPLNNLITDANLIPAPMTPTHILFTVVDNWYVAVNGEDSLADMALGRLPVNSSAQFTRYLDKMITQETANRTATFAGTWRSKIHFVAGNNKNVGDSFSTDMNTLISQVMTPAGFTTTTRIVTSSSSTDAGNIAIGTIRNINAGLYMVGFMGHGSSDKWTDAGVFSNTAALALTNTIYPVVTVFYLPERHFPRTPHSGRPTRSPSASPRPSPGKTTRGASAVIMPTGEAAAYRLQHPGARVFRGRAAQPLCHRLLGRRIHLCHQHRQQEAGGRLPQRPVCRLSGHRKWSPRAGIFADIFGGILPCNCDE